MIRHDLQAVGDAGRDQRINRPAFGQETVAAQNGEQVGRYVGAEIPLRFCGFGHVDGDDGDAGLFEG